MADRGLRRERGLPPQVLGAADDVSLLSPVRVPVDLTPARRRRAAPDAAEPAGGERAYLRVEGITGAEAAPLYSVYVNVPEGEDPADHPELRAGSVSTFGLEESSRTDDNHDGGGLTATFDITALRDRLAADGLWDEEHVDVSFSTHSPTAPGGTERRERDLQAGSDVRARRVAIMAG
jgi:tyrosinase